jgi:hypothetical protein
MIGMRVVQQDAHFNRGGSLMYFQHTDEAENRQGIKFTTRHAFLVLTGFVAAALGLRQVLESGLKVKQKVYQHSPVDKVLQALVGILGGCRFMKDLNQAAAPVSKDRSVSRAWGQKAFAHFSTVCRTLRAFTAQDVRPLADLLGSITKRRLEPILSKLAGPDGQGLIVIDVDLSGQKVRGSWSCLPLTSFDGPNRSPPNPRVDRSGSGPASGSGQLPTATPPLP